MFNRCLKYLGTSVRNYSCAAWKDLVAPRIPPSIRDGATREEEARARVLQLPEDLNSIYPIFSISEYYTMQVVLSYVNHQDYHEISSYNPGEIQNTHVLEELRNRAIGINNSHKTKSHSISDEIAIVRMRPFYVLDPLAGSSLARNAIASSDSMMHRGCTSNDPRKIVNESLYAENARRSSRGSARFRYTQRYRPFAQRGIDNSQPLVRTRLASRPSGSGRQLRLNSLQSHYVRAYLLISMEFHPRTNERTDGTG